MQATSRTLSSILSIGYIYLTENVISCAPSLWTEQEGQRRKKAVASVYIICYFPLPHVRMSSVSTLLLLIVLFIVSTSTSSSTSAAIYGDRSDVHTEAVGVPWTISTVAGSAGSSGSPKVYGIVATSAKLDMTRGVIVDGFGNLFISSDSHRVLKVTASTNLITVVAGTGSSGFSGDGLAATAATLNYPRGLALDKSGNIYVADSYNHRIRKITVSTGIITTVAGVGTVLASGAVDNVAATETRLNYPRDIAVDANGNIYIADTHNYRVRKVTASTGIISAFAGTGSTAKVPAMGIAASASTLYFPSGISVDSSGNVLIADIGYESIYKVTASTGKISLVAGNNGDDKAVLVDRPNCITQDSSGNIYFSDLNSNRIRKISNGVTSTIAGGSNTGVCQSFDYNGDGKNATLAILCQPHSIAIDSAGNVYFCDSGHRVVRKVFFSDATLSPSSTPDSPAGAPVSSSSSGSQSSSTRHVTGVHYLTNMLLSSFLIFTLNFHRDA